MTKVTKRAEKANDLLRGAKVERSGLKAQVAHSPGRRLKSTCWPSVRLAMVHPTTRQYAAENRLQVSPVFNPNRSLEKVSCHFLMTAIRKIALYMLDS